MTEEGGIVVERDGPVGWIRINRPERLNALAGTMREELADALETFEADPDIRCVVITGTGRAFCTGGDVSVMARLLDSGEEAAFDALVRAGARVVEIIDRMNKPVIASVQGYAAGYGMSLAMACDLTICADDARFALAYVRIGTSPDGTGTYMLPRIVGLKKAMEFALLGDDCDAQAAASFGLVNFVVPRAELEAETLKLARRLASGPTHALANVKRLIHASLDTAYEAQLQQEAEAFASNVATEDFREGVSAFAEKRKPKFKGR